MKYIGFIVLFLTGLSCIAETRIWESRTGIQKEANYVGKDAGTVTLRSPEGKLFRIRISQLIPEDQEYLKSLVRTGLDSSGETTSSNTEIWEGKPEVVSQMIPDRTFSRRAEGETELSYHVYVPPSFNADAPPPSSLLSALAVMGSKWWMP